MGFLDLSTSMTLNDLEPPREVSLNCSQFLAAAHISTLNYDEMDGDRTRQLVNSNCQAVARLMSSAQITCHNIFVS